MLVATKSVSSFLFTERSLISDFSHAGYLQFFLHIMYVQAQKVTGNSYRKEYRSIALFPGENECCAQKRNCH